jgi:hypothetical protein
VLVCQLFEYRDTFVEVPKSDRRARYSMVHLVDRISVLKHRGQPDHKHGAFDTSERFLRKILRQLEILPGHP